MGPPRIFKRLLDGVTEGARSREAGWRIAIARPQGFGYVDRVPFFSLG